MLIKITKNFARIMYILKNSCILCTIIARARKKAILIAGGSLPFGYEKWTVIRKED